MTRSRTIEATLPVVDVTAARSGGGELVDLAARIDEINRSIGFCCITGHGVPDAVIDDLYRTARAFFALPLDEKLPLSPQPGQFGRGYGPASRRALARTLDQASPPDLRETFSISPPDPPPDLEPGSAEARAFFGANRWPEAVPEMQAAWTAYYRAMDGLAALLVRLFEVALGVDEGRMAAACGRHGSSLLCNHYPPLGGGPAPGQLRAGAHTDYGSFTIVHPEPGSSGLQVHDGDEWQDVVAAPGSFVVNIGDLLARWTNDRWVSTLHRVVVPARQDWQRGRLSIVFFHQPDFDAEISCLESCAGPDGPRYPPVTSGQNWMTKMRKALDTP